MSLVLLDKAAAQFIPHGTLGTENSVVMPLNSLIDNPHSAG